jgi:hypothetical protein
MTKEQMIEIILNEERELYSTYRESLDAFGTNDAATTHAITSWSDDDDTIFIKGTIQPFTYKAVFTNNETEEESWCILNDIELNHLKSKL